MPLTLKLCSAGATGPVAATHPGSGVATIDILQFAPVKFEVNGTAAELAAARSAIYSITIYLNAAAGTPNTPKETCDWYTNRKYPVSTSTGRITIFHSACTVEQSASGGSDTINLKTGGGGHDNWQGTPNGATNGGTTCLDNNRPVLRGEYSVFLDGIDATELRFIVLPCRLWSLASLYFATLAANGGLVPPSPLKDFQPYQACVASNEGPHFSCFPLCNLSQANSTGAAGPPPPNVIAKIDQLGPAEPRGAEFKQDLKKTVYTLPAKVQLIQQISGAAMVCLFGHGPGQGAQPTQVPQITHTFQSYLDGFAKKSFRLDSVTTAQIFTYCHVALFIGCNTGYDNAGNLPLRAVQLGAKIALGFTKTTQQKGYTRFIEGLLKRIVATADRNTALSDIISDEAEAANTAFPGCNFDSWVIYYPVTLQQEDWRVFPPRYANPGLAPSGTVIWKRDKANKAGVATAHLVL